MSSVEDIREAALLPFLSPSAPYAMRAVAIKKAKTMQYGKYSPRWWEVYPEGHMSAFVFRVWRILGIPGGEEKGEELP